MKKEKICEYCKWYKGISLKESKERPLKTSNGNWISYCIIKDGHCCRYPEHKAVWVTHFCGEFKPNPYKSLKVR